LAEHYTRNTLECTAWCKKCQKMTQHRVDSGRKGPCIDEKHPQPPVRAKIPPFDPSARGQGNLFEK
jgi:hypothetical protein